MSRLLTLNPYRIDPRVLGEAAEEIRRGGVAVIPTDTVYAIVCKIDTKGAVDRLHRLKGVAPKAASKPLSVLFGELSDVSSYVVNMPTPAFRVMRRVLPGPYTFILRAQPRLSSAALQKRKTIGVRIPDDPVALGLLELLDAPLLATSVVHAEGESPLDDPIEISRRLEQGLDLVVDVGPIFPEPSTVVDWTEGYPQVVREGKGPVDAL